MVDILFPKLHKEGYRFVAIAAIATFVLLLLSKFFGLLSFALTMWVYFFFRNPDRYPINDENYLLSPADGVISQIVEINGPIELGLENKKYTRVSIFMNVFNCHVNRIPSSGKINQIFYKPGKYFNASLDKASEENERNYIKMSNNKGDELILTAELFSLDGSQRFYEKKSSKIENAKKLGKEVGQILKVKSNNSYKR